MPNNAKDAKVTMFRPHSTCATGVAACIDPIIGFSVHLDSTARCSPFLCFALLRMEIVIELNDPSIEVTMREV
jgi:hypothetical protein